MLKGLFSSLFNINFVELKLKMSKRNKQRQLKRLKKSIKIVQNSFKVVECELKRYGVNLKDISNVVRPDFDVDISSRKNRRRLHTMIELYRDACYCELKEVKKETRSRYPRNNR